VVGALVVVTVDRWTGHPVRVAVAVVPASAAARAVVPMAAAGKGMRAIEVLV
jgi:hypothetical protein